MRLIDADKGLISKIQRETGCNFITAQKIVDSMSAVEERKVGKCTDCNEYNQEKHYCPKFCDVIRDTTKEMQEFDKGEHEKLERIEQIINEVQLYEDCYRAINKIKEVLKNG